MIARAGVLACAAVLGLSSCASAPAPAAECAIGTVATLPITLFRGHPVVSASVDGRPVPLLLDTGAETTALTHAAAAAIGLQEDPRRRSNVQGIGGSTQMGVTQTVVALAGKGRFIVLPLIDLPTQQDAPELAGILGTDVLSDFDVEIDMERSRLTLFTSHGCQAGYMPPGGPWSMLKPAITPRQRVLVPVRIGAIDLSAMLDTGAEGTILAPDAARRAGVTDAQIAAGAPVVVVGAALRNVTMRQIALPELQVGAEHLPGYVVTVPPAALNDVNMLLGTDYFAHHRVWISFSTRAVFVQRAGP